MSNATVVGRHQFDRSQTQRRWKPRWQRHLATASNRIVICDLTTRWCEKHKQRTLFFFYINDLSSELNKLSTRIIVK